MGEMVDLVAEVLYKDATRLFHWADPKKLADESPDTREHFRELARAAIDAMRATTEEMCQAGNDTGAVANDIFYIQNDDIRTVYGAMIDAALGAPRNEEGW